MAQYDLNLREYWRVIRRRKIIIILTIALTAAFSLVTALMEKPVPVYKAGVSIKIERSRGGIIFEMGGPPLDDLQTQVATIKSYHMMELLAKKLGMIPEALSSEEVRNSKQHLGVILDLKGRVDAKTDAEGRTSIIDMFFRSEDAKFAQKAANTLAQVYKTYRYEELNRIGIESKKAIVNQLEVAREKLRASEEAVKKFKEDHKLVSIDGESAAVVQQLAAAKTEYEKMEASYHRNGEIVRRLDRAENKPLTSKTSFFYEGAPSIYSNLNDRLVKLMLDRDTLLITYTDQFPQIVEIKKEIHEVVSSMRAHLTSLNGTYSEDMRVLKTRIEDLEAKVKGLPQKGLEFARLQRDVQVNLEVFTLLNKKHEESLIQNAAGRMIETVTVVKPALEPTAPINPTKTAETFGVGILIGIALGIIFAFLLETFDTSIGAIEEIEEFLRVPVLGLIPHINLEDVKAVIREKYGGEIDPDIVQRDARLVSHFAPNSTMAESYRSVRTNLSFACLERDVKTVLVTSSSPQEGKTSTVVNLAITMAQAGHRVLLIEGDLRKPVIAKMFGLPHFAGLTDAMLGNIEWKKVVRTIADIMAGRMSIDDILKTPGIENLHILPAGTVPPNPAELVSSKGMGELIEKAKAEYDYILIDAPPVLSATDAAILGSKADAVVIVYRVGRIPRGALRRAKSQLDHVKAKVIGIILNGLKAELSIDYADYKYRNYYYYSGKQHERKSSWGRAQALLRSAADLGKERVEGLLKRKSTPADGKAASVAPGKSFIDKVHDLKSRGAKEAVSAGGSRLSRMKTLLLVIAAAVLVAGILYQAGYLGSDDPPLPPPKVEFRKTPPPTVGQNDGPLRAAWTGGERSAPGQRDDKKEQPPPQEPNAAPGSVASPGLLKVENAGAEDLPATGPVIRQAIGHR